MSDEWEWSDWIAHDDKGWPNGVEPDEIVLADLSGDIMPPMPAVHLTWHCPGDPVSRFKRRNYRPPTKMVEREMELAE